MPGQRKQLHKQQSKIVTPSLPHDILREVATYLPAYCFVGSRTIHSVSKVFNTPILNRKDAAINKKNYYALVNSCKSPLDALNILTDRTIFNNLLLDHCLQLAGHHPELAHDLLDDPLILNKLPRRGVVQLGLSNERIALHIVSTPSLKQKLNYLQLEELGKAYESVAFNILEVKWDGDYEFGKFEMFANFAYEHPNIAHAILDNPVYMRIYHFYPKYFNGKNHLSVVKRILESPDLFKYLDGSDLVTISQDYPSLIQHIFDTQALREKLHKDALPELGANETVAFQILNTPALCDQLDELGFAILCCHHLTVAKYILSTDKLKNLPFYLLAVGKKHLSVALQLLNDSEFCDKLSSHDLVDNLGVHKESAKMILSTPSLYNKLTGDNLCKLGLNQNPSIAHQIFNSPELSIKLTHEHWAQLGERHETIAQAILAKIQICNTLKSADLAKLGKHPQIAKTILASPQLYTKLVSIDVINLCQNTACALMVLNTPELCEKLEDYFLAGLGERFSTVALQILQTPLLCAKLSGRLLATMGESSYQVAIEILSRPSLRIKLDNESINKLINCRLGVYHAMKNTPWFCNKRFLPEILDIRILENFCAIYFRIQQKAIALRNKEASFAKICPYNLRKHARAR